MRSLGFWRGFSASFTALGTLAKLSAAWPYALVPALVFWLLEAGIVVASWRFLKPWVDAQLTGGGSLQRIGAEAASWASVAVMAVLGWLVALLLAPPLSAPALERIVRLVERDWGAPERAPLGFLAELGCGLRSLLVGSSITVPIIVLLTLLELGAPPVSVVTTPLKLLVGALGVAWGLFDYPLTLRGVGARQRLAFMRRNLSVVLGFGAAFVLLFWLPCCGILMLPVGVTAATRLLWDIERGGSPVLGPRAD